MDSADGWKELGRISIFDLESILNGVLRICIVLYCLAYCDGLGRMRYPSSSLEFRSELTCIGSFIAINAMEMEIYYIVDTGIETAER